MKIFGEKINGYVSTGAFLISLGCILIAGSFLWLLEIAYYGENFSSVYSSAGMSALPVIASSQTSLLVSSILGIILSGIGWFVMKITPRKYHLCEGFGYNCLNEVPANVNYCAGCKKVSQPEELSVGTESFARKEENFHSPVLPIIVSNFGRKQNA